jgi:PIN domain nuclease of toxin-antitoxin system
VGKVRLLLDTHVLIWWLGNAAELSPRLRSAVADPANDIFVSSVSAFEITTKFRIGKLPSAALLAMDVPGHVERAGFLELPLASAHAARAGLLSHAHRDPFDRLLAAQALVEGLRIASVDKVFDQLMVERIE